MTFRVKKLASEKIEDKKTFFVKFLIICIDNCYASKLDASMQQDDWIVSKSSKFSYKSFAIGGSKKLKQKTTMRCTVKICTTSNLDACRTEINETDEKCPKYDGSYQFTAHGAPK